jgi:hypothetical protein
MRVQYRTVNQSQDVEIEGMPVLDIRARHLSLTYLAVMIADNMRQAKQSYLFCEGNFGMKILVWMRPGMDGDKIDVISLRWDMCNWPLHDLSIASHQIWGHGKECHTDKKFYLVGKDRSLATMEHLKARVADREWRWMRKNLTRPVPQEGQHGYSINSLGKSPNIPVCRLILLPIWLSILMPNHCRTNEM